MSTPKKLMITQALEKILQDLVARKGIRHAVIGLERGNGEFRWIGAAGEASADGRAMEEETPYHIASVTKLLIAASVLKLHERGDLDIENPVTGYLPKALTEGLHVWNGVDRTSEITLRHLLAHASGLPDWLVDPPRSGRSLFAEMETMEDRFISIEELVDFVKKKLTPLFPPLSLNGARQRIIYSDTNFQLLIAVLEARMQMPLREIFDELIYKPLGLRHTFHPGQVGKVPKDSTPMPATLWAGDVPFTRPLLLESFRDVYSTAGDQLTFMRGLVTGKLFQNSETAALMQENWNRFGFPTNMATLARPGWPIEYGLGMMRFELPRIFSGLRKIPPVVGHTGATGSWLFFCSELDLYLCGTVDQTTAAPVPFRVVPKILAVAKKVFGTESKA